MFVSHDLDEAMKLGNRIAILEGGRVVQIGTAEDILLTPGQRLCRRIRQAHEPAERAARRLGDDAGRATWPATARTCCSTGNGRIRVALDGDGRPLAARSTGPPARWSAPRPATRGKGADIIVAPVDLKMRLAIELRRGSGNPIVLVDELGRMAGLCGDDEIYRALLRARQSEGAAAG